MRKVVAAALFASAALGSFASGGVMFSNKLGTGTIDSWHWSSNGDEVEGRTKFAGFYDRVRADYAGDVIRVGADATFSLTPWNYKDGTDETYYAVDWDSDSVNWYAEFSPVDILALGFSDELYTEGAHLPVLDSLRDGGRITDGLRAGNYSTNGFALLVRPKVEGLTFAAGFDYRAYFDSYDNDRHDSADPALAIGVDYTSEKFSIGAAGHHITNSGSRLFGVFASIKAVDKLKLNLGFTHSKDGDVGLWDVDYAPGYKSWHRDSDGVWRWHDLSGRSGMGGRNVATVGVSYSFSPFDFAADLAVNLDADDSLYDLYTAVDFLIGLDKVSKGLGIDVKGFLLYDMEDPKGQEELGTTWGIRPQIVYRTGNSQGEPDAPKHELRAGLAVQSKFKDDRDWGGNKYWYISLPVSWKYTY